MTVFRAVLMLRLRRRSLAGSLALLAVASLATAGVIAGLEARRGAAARLDRLFVEVGSPDLVLGGGPTGVPAGLEAALDGGVIVESSAFDAVFASFPRGDGTSVGFEIGAIDDPTELRVGRPVLRDGRWAEHPDEIVFDAGAAEVHGVDVGDRVRFDVGGGLEHERTVAGLAVDLGGCFYPACTPLRGFVTTDGMAELAPDGTYMRARARVAEGWDPAEASERIRSDALVDAVEEWDAIRSDLLLPGRVFSAMLAGFGVFVLAASVLVVANTAIGSVVARRRELGLLRALGVTPAELTRVTVAEHAVIGAVGIVAGWLVGSMLGPRLHLGLGVLGREPARFDPAALAMAGAAVLVILVVATATPARRAGQASTRSALADHTPAGGSRAAFLPLSPAGQLGVQLALARPIRAFLAAAAIAVAIAGGLAGWRVSTAVDLVANDRAHSGDPYDAVVAAPLHVAPADIESRLSATAGVGSWYTEIGVTASLVTGSGSGDEVALRAIGPDIDAARFVIAEGRRPTAPGEALVGWGLVRDGRVALGDHIEVETADGPIGLIAVGRHGDLDRAGDVVVVSAATYRAAGGTGRAHWRVTGTPSIDRLELAARLESTLGGLAVVQPAGDPDGQLRPFRWVLATLVGLVTLVAAANLAATVLAGLRERRREIGLARAIGFGHREVLVLISTTGATLGVVGALLGVPLGLAASDWIIDAAVDRVGLGPGVIEAPVLVPGFLAVVVAVVLASLVSLSSTNSMLRTPAAALVRE